MTHKDEICYWAEHPDGTSVWFKRPGYGWALYSNTTPKWNKDTKYITDNEWAGLRKAQADGKQLQVKTVHGHWVNSTLKIRHLKTDDIENWRIKPEGRIYEWQYYRKLNDDTFKLTFLHYANEEEIGAKHSGWKKFEPSKRERK